MNKRIAVKLWQRALCAVLTLSLLPVAAGAATPYTAQKAKAYDFYAAIESSLEDSKRVMYFTEDYFNHPASSYNPSLASASLCMAMSAFGSNQIYKSDGTYDFSKANRNWLALFKDELGFNDAMTNAYFTQPTRTDDVGYGMAWKMITVSDWKGEAVQVPLIAVGVRGSNYMSEWGGNVNIGLTGDHAGFKQAAESVLAGVKSYIGSNPSLKGKDVKIWISGFSRAAATSNLFAGYLDEAIKDGSIEKKLGAKLNKDDLYCYTFETPAGTIKDYAIAHGDTYDNIFNIINPNDLVPKVAPYFKDAAFVRYGQDMNLPSSITAKDYAGYENVMKAIYAKLTEGKHAYIIDKFVNRRLELTGVYNGDVSMPQSAAEFCSRFVADLASEAVRTRKHFTDTYQAALTGLMDFFCGSGERFGGKANQNKMLKYFGEHGVWIGWVFVKKLIGEWKWPKENVVNAAIEILTTASKDTGVKLTDEYIREVSEMAASILWELLGDHPLDNLREYNYYLTFTHSASNILQAHEPDVCLAWMMSMDKNYEKTTGKYQNYAQVYNGGEYRAVTLTGVMTAKVETLDASGKTIETREYAASALGSRQLRILLPADCAYRLSIHSTAITGSISFDYLVSEYNPSINGVKRVFYYKNPVDTKSSYTVYTALIPAFSPQDAKNGLPEGSALDYRLSYNGVPIPRVSVNLLLSDLRGNGKPAQASLQIISHPASQTAKEGEMVAFTVKAQGVNLNYQWYEGDAESDHWRLLEGANADTFSAPVYAQERQYMCRVGDLYGDVLFSNAASAIAELPPVPVTGDESAPKLWTLLLLVSLLGCALVILSIKKRRIR